MNRVERRKKNLKLKKFGINVNQYRLMLEEQNDTCFICDERDANGRDLAVDHCHESGKVRGLLCSSCNTALGHFKDNTALLQRAIEYLERDYEAPLAHDFDEYIDHQKRARWKLQVITPEKTFSSAMDAAKYYNVHETTVHGWLGKLKRYPHLKKEGWECVKVFTAE